MIENDCSRQSKNQRGESLSSSLLQKNVFNASRRASERVSTAEHFSRSFRQPVDREGFV